MLAALDWDLAAESVYMREDTRGGEGTAVKMRLSNIHQPTMNQNNQKQISVGMMLCGKFPVRCHV